MENEEIYYPDNGMITGSGDITEGSQEDDTEADEELNGVVKMQALVCAMAGAALAAAFCSAPEYGNRLFSAVTEFISSPAELFPNPLLLLLDRLGL